MAVSTITPDVPGVDLLRFVPANIRRLVAAGVIGSDAASLALQLIAKMQGTRKAQITHTMGEAMGTSVTLNGSPYAGPVGHDLLNAVGALQQVHQFLGFFNHHDESELRTANPDTHFSADPTEHYGREWIRETPIHFRFDFRNMSYWTALARVEYETAAEKFDIVNVSTGD